MAKKQSQKSSGVAGGDMDGNVDKIRQILFGGQMRDYEQRFAELEGRLTKNIERLESANKREIEKLSEQVKSERKNRQDEGKKSARAFKQFAEQVETWYAELEEQIDSETRETRDSLKENSNAATAMIQEANAGLGKKLLAETRKLADTKIAREDLHRLFSDLAERLKKGSNRSDA